VRLHPTNVVVYLLLLLLLLLLPQVRYILGYRVPRVDTLYEIIEVLIAGRAGFKWKECVMGLAMLAFLISLKVLSKRVKKLHWIGALGPIMACAISIVAVVAGKLDKRGIKIVEKIPQGEDATKGAGRALGRC
jgi:MFS superfamily sulfate permease-like transporter